MNKFSILTQTLILTTCTIGMALADNFPSSHSLYKRWAGLYVGIDGGMVFNNVQLRSQQLGFTNPSETCNANANFLTYFPGIQWGSLHQFSNNMVLGIEANITFNKNSPKTLGCTCPNNIDVSDRFSFKNKMQSTIKGRWGHVLNWNKNSLLPYLTAGASFANVGLTYTNEGNDYYSKNTSPVGPLIGTGIEWALKSHWSFRIEYSYIDYGTTVRMKILNIYDLIDTNGNARAGLNTNNLMMAINYWV